MALHPSDVQSDILRLQRNIVESIRQLNVQNEQLEVLHRLLAELNRIQQASGVTAATDHELPPIAPLNPLSMSSFTPQAYVQRGAVLRRGYVGVPEGLRLPEGWTLRWMTLAPPSTSGITSTQLPSSQPETEAGPSTSTTVNTQTHTESVVPSPAGVEPSSSPRPAESSSLESSWSFGNMQERNDAEGSSLAVAGYSSDAQNVTRRTVIVEDAEDNGQ